MVHLRGVNKRTNPTANGTKIGISSMLISI
jgi:hypothetical protein